MRCLLAYLVLALVLPLPLAAMAAAGQERVTFDRRLHLAGYQEVIFSPFADLYDLEPFREAEGKLVGHERLDELRRAWEAERARVEALLDAERSDPKRWALFLLERALADHAFFAHADWTRVDDAGFVVYVQKPRKEEEGYATRVARECTARLAPLREHFHRTYVEPAELERRDDFGAEVVFVLATAGDLDAYARLAGPSPHYQARSYYDPKLRAAILLEDPLEKQVTREEKDRYARHAYAHLLLHAHETGTVRPLQEDWLREGLASYLSDHEPRAEGGLAPTTEPEILRLLVAAMQSRDTVLTHVRRVADLYAAPTYQHVTARAVSDARREGRDPRKIDHAGLRLCNWREARLLVEFLHRDEHRSGLLRLLADELAGNGGLAAFHRAFPALDAEAMDRAFLEHLIAEHRRLFPEVPLAAGAVDAVLRRDVLLLPAGSSPAAPPAAASERSAPPPARTVAPAELAPRDLAPEASLALALDLARRGRSGEAEARLAGVLAGALASDIHARLARAREQVAAWNRLRAAWFEGLAETGGAYRFEHGGKVVRAKIERVEDGVVHLAENRSGVATLALDDLDPLDLAKQMGRDADALEGGWARVLPYALAGERKAAQMLDSTDPAQAALAADLAGDLPGLCARGLPLGELDLLSREPMPADPAACEDALERLAAVLAGAREAPEIVALGPEIRGYARQALEVVFDREGPPQLVRGAWEGLPGGRVRLTYEFADAAELADFIRDDAHRAERHPPLGELEVERDEVRVAGGMLQAIGKATLRHRLGFAAPLAVHYEVSYRKDPGAPAAKSWFLLVGVCDDGSDSYAGALGQIDLEALVDGEVRTAYADVRQPMYEGKTYAMELTCDAEGAVRLTLNGKPQQELGATGLKSGGLFLLVHSDMHVQIRKLVIEGALDEAGLAGARAAWIEEAIEARGL